MGREGEMGEGGMGRVRWGEGGMGGGKVRWGREGGMGRVG